MVSFLKKVYYFLLFKLFRVKFIVRNNYSGFELKVQIVDPISYEWYNKRWAKLPEIEFIHRHTREVKLVFDLGAHHGVIAMILSKTFPDSKVVSVEAIPNNHNQCLINYKLNGLDNIISLNNAISDVNSIITFENTSNGVLNQKGSSNIINISTLKIEDLILNFGVPDVIFIDIEGFEQKALDGILNTDSILNTVFFIEVHINCGLEENGGDLKSIISFFQEHDSHNLFYLKEGDFYVQKISNESVSVIADRFYLIALPNNTNNLCAV
jgi:FkbM family methyltransferase